ncbi:hypothetical protein [Thermaurantiacus sp.]
MATTGKAPERGATGGDAGGGRRTRPALSRTAPDRSTSGGTETDPAGAGDPGRGSPAPDTLRDVEQVIADAVALGYSVVGDNLAHGRSVATRLSQGSYKLNHAADDVTSAGQRLLKLAGDMGRVWIDLVGAVARDPDLHDALRREHPQPSPGARTGWTFTSDARGNRRVRILPYTLDMSSAPSDLACSELAIQGGSCPPITGISFTVIPAIRHVFVVVDVPASQGAGHYLGTVRAIPGNKVVGTLSLEVTA